jgi:hypothetical protein
MNHSRLQNKSQIPLDFEQAVSANAAVAFAAYQQINFSCGKSNGTTSIILFNKGSVGVCRVMCSVRIR